MEADSDLTTDAGERVDELDGVVFADSWDAGPGAIPDEGPAPPSAPTRAEAGTRPGPTLTECRQRRDSPT